MRIEPVVLVLALALAGCVGLDSDDGLRPTDGAADAPHTEAVPVEHPGSIDLAVPFHVFYVNSHRCAVDFVEVDGPIVNVAVTATWDYSVPVVGENQELTIYDGSTIPQDSHTRFPQGSGIAQEEGPSPLSLAAEVAAGNQVGLVVCDWSDVVVREDFDVHIEGSLRYVAPTSRPPRPTATGAVERWNEPQREARSGRATCSTPDGGISPWACPWSYCSERRIWRSKVRGVAPSARQV